MLVSNGNTKQTVGYIYVLVDLFLISEIKEIRILKSLTWNLSEQDFSTFQAEFWIIPVVLIRLL